MDGVLINDKKRLNNVTWVAIASLIISILALATTIVTVRYNMRGAQEAHTWDTTFQVNQSTSVIETKKHWSKGTLRYGMNQKSGTQRTAYQVFYKKGNGSYNLVSKNAPAKNNFFYGPYTLHKANGTSKYSYKLIKTNNRNRQSRVAVDLMIF